MKFDDLITTRMSFLKDYNGTFICTSEDGIIGLKGKYPEKNDDDINIQLERYKNIIDSNKELIEEIKNLFGDGYAIKERSTPFNAGGKGAIKGCNVVSQAENSCYWWYAITLISRAKSALSISLFIYLDHVEIRIENDKDMNNEYCKKISEVYKDCYSVKENYNIEIKDKVNTIKKTYETINETKLKNTIGKAFGSGKKQVILTGAPGTGKTFTAREYASEMIEIEFFKANADAYTDKENFDKAYKNLDNCDVNKWIEKAKELKCLKQDRIKFVQFHPSFDYTDFVEGLKPVQLSGTKNDEYSFVRVDGIFKAFCRKIEEANKNPENRSKDYYFIIDEINRADLSKVFGELMYGLEESYRWKSEYCPQSQYSYLPTYGKKTKVFGEK